MDPEEGREAVVELVLGTAALLDRPHWSSRPAAVWADQCTHNGDKQGGAQYSYDRLAPRGTEHARDARIVAEHWESLGMRVRTVQMSGPVVFAEGGPVLRATFDTNGPADTYQIVAIAPCGAGNAYELNVRDEADRERGIPIPGDDGLSPTPPTPGAPAPSTPQPTTPEPGAL